MLSFSLFAVCTFDKENKRFLMVVDSKQASVPELTDYMQLLNFILWQSCVNTFNSPSLCTVLKGILVCGLQWYSDCIYLTITKLFKCFAT